MTIRRSSYKLHADESPLSCMCVCVSYPTLLPSHHTPTHTHKQTHSVSCGSFLRPGWRTAKAMSTALCCTRTPTCMVSSSRRAFVRRAFVQPPIILAAQLCFCVSVSVPHRHTCCCALLCCRFHHHLFTCRRAACQQADIHVCQLFHRQLCAFVVAVPARPALAVHARV